MTRAVSDSVAEVHTDKNTVLSSFKINDPGTHYRLLSFTTHSGCKEKSAIVLSYTELKNYTY